MFSTEKFDQFSLDFQPEVVLFPPKSADFSKFSRLHAPCGKKLVKMGSENGKIAKKKRKRQKSRQF